ncbi:hypothetical protein RsS62_09970 [Rhizobium dioscoreae]|uniref:hypothetical protein n=1 Tax=Rhizobium dioscoreae TaxID=2653122 RepID=UPI0012612C4E|nr:hypothetical protein [Rhizobium dioscoreae]GES41745.1 hypothetical protein RsS62_09970 [Rhizobium dioscoreae]
MASDNNPQAFGNDEGIPRVPSPYRSVKGPASVSYRSKVARDLAWSLDVNPSIVAWECGSRSLVMGPVEHKVDFTAFDREGIKWLLDAPDRKPLVCAGDLSVAAAKKGFQYRLVDRSEIYDGFRLRNASDLLRYSGHNVSLGDRIRLLAFLDENGSLSFGECLQVIRESQPVAALASLILQGMLEVDLDEALIGPETKVKRMRS